MARLLIVSRSLALGMRLTDLHEVEERSADELENGLPGVEGFEVLVLDVGDPVLAVNTVNSLREDEQAIPVMLVSGYQPEWEQVEAQQVEGVHVVPLPITRQALLRGVAVLLDEDPELISVDPTGAMPLARRTEPDDEDTVRAPLPALPASAGSADPAEEREDPELEDAREGSGAEGPGSGDPAAGAGRSAPKTGATAKAVAKAVPQTGAAAAATQAAALAKVRKAAEAMAKAKKKAGSPSAPPKPPKPAEDKPVQLATGASAPGPRPQPQNPPTGRLGQQIAARRTAGQGPQHDRSRWTGNRQNPPSQAIEVQPSPVAGLSYSTPVARPFSDPPPTGQFPGAGRGSRWQRGPAAPETGSMALNSSNIAANRRNQHLGDRPRKLQRRSGPVDNVPRTPGRGLVTDPLGPRTDPYGLPTSSALERRLDTEAADRSGLPTVELIQALYERSGELYGVSDTSQMLADDVTARVAADAAAILVPDGPVWRVSGGVGLRPVERRMELRAAHWLVGEIGSGRAILVDDTDIVRQQLAGAPLAAWRHLLAVPVPDVRVIVMLARGDEGEAFTEYDLATVYPPVREAAGLLHQAIETRRLARALAPLREPEPER